MSITAFWSAPPMLFEQAFAPAAGAARLPGMELWGVQASALARAPPSSKAPAVELTAKRKRHNISDACAACRRSKVKCDELKPCRRCLRDGRRVACVPWRDGQGAGEASHRSPALANAYTYAEVSAQHGAVLRQGAEVAAASKRRRMSKPNERAPPAVQGAAWPQAEAEEFQGQPVGAPQEQEQPGAVASQVALGALREARHTDELKMEEASALLLAFAQACRKDVAGKRDADVASF
jgi:hypothetical protein